MVKPACTTAARRPHHSPNRKVFAPEEELILSLRRKRRLGVKRLRIELLREHGLKLALDTVHKVLVRHDERFLKRRPDLSRAEFAAAWDEHRPTPPTATRYVRNHPVHDPLPLFPFDGIGECWFASVEDAVASVSGGARTPEFADPEGCVTMLTSVVHRWPKN